jgi:hypothetical protein
MSRKNTSSRRDFVRSGALVAAACASPLDVFSLAHELPTTGEVSPIRLGLASYTFRNLSRGQIIGFMKQLNVFELNAKDVKDHLPMDPQAEAAALTEYAAAGIKLHAAGAIYFTKDDDADIRSKFRILQASGYCRYCGWRPCARNFAAHRKVRKGVRHPHRDP